MPQRPMDMDGWCDPDKGRYFALIKNQPSSLHRPARAFWRSGRASCSLRARETPGEGNSVQIEASPTRSFFFSLCLFPLFLFIVTWNPGRNPAEGRELQQPPAMNVFGEFMDIFSIGPYSE